MKQKLSVVMITRNASATIKQALNSVQSIANEILVIDSDSTDDTISYARQFQARILNHIESDFGKQKRFGVMKARYDWALILDSDEVVPKALSDELTSILDKPKYQAYYIPFQPFLFSTALHHGGETYKKLIFFNRTHISISDALLHEKFIATTPCGKTKNKILHYSYRSLTQMYAKFTDYAQRDYKQKLLNKEKSSLRKVFIYPLHMFWSRYIKDSGYKDGPVRIFLDLGFAYMEFLTYLKLLMKQVFI